MKSNANVFEFQLLLAVCMWIKKYPNRRLYNTATSQYIVLNDIVDLVKSGNEFIIEDKKTGEDITRSILNQIIYERETAYEDYHFPLDVQKQLILMYDDAYGKMMPDYLRQSMQVFVAERDRMQNALDEMFTYNSKTMTQLGENLAKQNMEFFHRAMDFFQSMSGISRNAQNHGDEGNKSDAKQKKLKDIQDQIEALQAELKSLK